MKKLLLVAGSLISFSLTAQHRVPKYAPQQSIIFDQLVSRDGIARVGIYGPEYPLMGIEVYVKALGLIDVMPDSALQALAKCGFNGSADAVKAQLKKMVGEDASKQEHARRIYLSAVVVDGVAVRRLATEFNIVLHEAWLSWLQDKIDVKGFFNMGIFGADGITERDIAFNTFTPNVEVNPHSGRDADVLEYSPNNAKFGVEASRGVVSFWVVACTGDKVLISYQVLLLTEHVRDQFSSVWRPLFQQAFKPQEQMNQLVRVLQYFSNDKQIKDEVLSAADAHAFRPVLATLAPLRVVPQKQPAGAPAKAAQETKRGVAAGADDLWEQWPDVDMPQKQPVAQEVKRVVAERGPEKAQATSSDDLALLHHQLLALSVARA